MNTYSTKSNAQRAAKKIEGANVEQQADGTWGVVLPVTEETWAEQRARIAATEYDLVNVPFEGVEPDADFNNQGHCPCCGVHLSNGVATYEDICDTSKSDAGKMVMEYTCLGCGGEWGPVIQRKARSTKPVKHNGNQIDKVRETRNGKTRPSRKTIGGQLWAAYDDLIASGVEVLTSEHARSVAELHNINVTSALCALSHWRKFNGLTK
jgi:hypothetical protein